MNKNGLGDEGVFIEPNLDGEESKVIFNGEEVPVKGKKTYKKVIKHHMQKEENDNFKKKYRRNKIDEKDHDCNEQSDSLENKDIQNKKGVKQMGTKENIASAILEDKVTPNQMRKAIVWAEILGKPVCKTRGNRRQGRR